MWPDWLCPKIQIVFFDNSVVSTVYTLVNWWWQQQCYYGAFILLRNNAKMIYIKSNISFRSFSYLLQWSKKCSVVSNACPQSHIGACQSLRVVTRDFVEAITGYRPIFYDGFRDFAVSYAVVWNSVPTDIRLLYELLLRTLAKHIFLFLGRRPIFAVYFALH